MSSDQVTKHITHLNAQSEFDRGWFEMATGAMKEHASIIEQLRLKVLRNTHLIGQVQTDLIHVNQSVTQQQSDLTRVAGESIENDAVFKGTIESAFHKLADLHDNNLREHVKDQVIQLHEKVDKIAAVAMGEQGADMLKRLEGQFDELVGRMQQTVQSTEAATSAVRYIQGQMVPVHARIERLEGARSGLLGGAEA